MARERLKAARIDFYDVKRKAGEKMTIYLETKDTAQFEKIVGYIGEAGLKCSGFTRMAVDCGDVRIDEEIFNGTVLRRKTSWADERRDAWHEFFSGAEMI